MFPIIFPFAGLEIKRRQLDTLSFQQLAHISVEPLCIDRVQALEVVIAVRVPRRFFSC